MKKSKNEQKKGRNYEFLLVLTLIAVIFVSGFVSAYTGASWSDEYLIKDMASDTTAMYHINGDTGQVWEIDDYLYFFGGYSASTSMYKMFQSSDDYGETWADASSAITIRSGRTPYWRNFMFDCVYDNETEIFHIANGASTSGDGNEYYRNASVTVPGTLGLGTAVSLVTITSYDAGPVAICEVENKPVEAFCYYNYTETDYRLGVSWSTDIYGTSFNTVWSSTNTLIGINYYYQLSLHPINSSAVLLLMRLLNADAKVYGVIVTPSGFGSAFEASTNSVKYVKDTNNYQTNTLSTISESTVNPNDYAETVALIYLDGDRVLNFDLFDVATQTITLNEEIETTASSTYYPYWVGSALDNGEYWAFIANRTASTTMLTSIYDRSAVDTWDKTTYDTADTISISDMNAYALSRFPIQDNLYIFMKEQLDDTYTYYIEAYGPEPTPAPTATPGPDVFDFIVDNFGFFLAFIGLCMVFFGGWLFIKSGKEKDMKQLFNATMFILIGGALCLGYFLGGGY